MMGPPPARTKPSTIEEREDVANKPPMTELRYFVSDKGVGGEAEDDKEEEDQDEFNEFLPPQRFVGGSSVHSRNSKRFSVLSTASSITLDLSERDEDDDELFCEDFLGAPPLTRSATADSMPTLPQRRRSSRSMLADSTPKMPGRRASSATFVSKSTVTDTRSSNHNEEGRQGSVRFSIANAGA